MKKEWNEEETELEGKRKTWNL